MDVTTMLRRIKRQFGDEYDVIITDDDIYGWIHEAELDIIRNAPDCNVYRQTTAANTYPLAIPNVVTIQRISYNGTLIEYTTQEDLETFGITDSTLAGAATPRFWFLRGRTATLVPTNVTFTGSTSIEYTKTPMIMAGAPGDVTNVLSVPDVYHTDVISYCLARAHNKNQNAQSEKMQMDMYDKSIALRRDEATTIDQNTYKGWDPADLEASWSY
jgi:hypothetical protein